MDAAERPTRLWITIDFSLNPLSRSQSCKEGEVTAGLLTICTPSAPGMLGCRAFFICLRRKPARETDLSLQCWRPPTRAASSGGVAASERARQVLASRFTPLTA
jgi:hypothetical protein